jgi:hypothetical protein
LHPGETNVETVWLLLGITKKKVYYKKPALEFIFKSDGEYTITFSPPFDQEITIKVKRPVKEKDKEAFQSFEAQLAEEFIYYSANTSARKVKDFFKTHQKSYLAPFAAYSLGERINNRKKIGKKIDFNEYVRYYTLITEKHPGHVLCPAAYYHLVIGYSAESNKKKAREMYMKLTERFPESYYVSEIKKDPYLVRKKEADEFKPLPATNDPEFSVKGRENIPDDIEQIFVDFWKKIAFKQIDEASGYLSDDYEGGGKKIRNWQESWHRYFEKFNLEGLKVEIIKHKKTAAYARPDLWKKEQKTWHGELILVYSKNTYHVIDRIKKEKETGASKVIITALRKQKNIWVIVSEYQEPSRNAIAAKLLYEFDARLDDSLRAAVVFDGNKEINLWKLLVQRLGISDEDVKDASLKFGSETMGGEQYDRADREGTLKITYQKSGKPAAETYKVFMRLQLTEKKDKLKMTGLEVKK